MVIIVGGPRWKPQWKPNGDALPSSYLTLNWRSGRGLSCSCLKGVNLGACPQSHRSRTPKSKQSSSPRFDDAHLTCAVERFPISASPTAANGTRACFFSPSSVEKCLGLARLDKPIAAGGSELILHDSWQINFRRQSLQMMQTRIRASLNRRCEALSFLAPLR